MKSAKIKIFFFILVVFSFSNNYINSQSQWQTNLLYGREVKFLYTDNHIIYAVTNVGTFYSSDGGNFWSGMKLSNELYNYSCHRLTTIGSEVFVNSYNNTIFSTSNFGISWNEYHIVGPLTVINSLVSKGTVLYAGTSDGIYISTDRGFTWTISNSGLSNLNISTIVIHEERIFASSMGGVFLSTDNGKNWIPKNNGIFDFRIRSLHFQNESLYAGTDSGKVFLTTDFGDNWSERSAGLPVSGIGSFASLGNNIFAGNYRSGIFGSSNGGLSWIQLNSGFSSVPNVLSLETYQDKIFAGIGAQAKGLYFTTNLGLIWNVANSGLKSGNFNCITGRGSIIYAGITFGTDIYQTSNNGSSWTKISNLPEFGFLQSMIFRKPYIFATSHGGGFYRSPDTAFHWGRMSPSEIPINLYDIIAKDEFIFVQSRDSGIFRSTNDGVNWAAVNNGLSDFNITGIIACGENLVTTTASGIFFSTNNGNNWNRVNDMNYMFRGLFSIDSLIFTSSHNTGFIMSTNFGINWEVRNPSVHYGFLSGNGNFLIGSNSDKMYFSHDNGFSWTENSYGFWGAYVSSFYFNDEYIFATTDRGVYRLKISDIVSVNSTVQHIPESFSLYQNYPNPFNPVTKIRFDIFENSIVTLKIYDLLGREIKTLINNLFAPGSYYSEFNSSNLVSGIYFCRIEVTVQKTKKEMYSKTIKMIHLK